MKKFIKKYKELVIVFIIIIFVVLFQIVKIKNHTNDETTIEKIYEYGEEIVISENTINEFTQEEMVISTQEGGRFVKLGDIAIYANDFDEYIYIFNIKENTYKKLYHAEDGIEKIYFDGEYIYLLPSYYRGKGITKIDLLGNAHKIYEGSSLQLWIENDKIYFVDQIGYDQINGTPQGNLCTMKNLYQRPSKGNNSTLFLIDVQNKSQYECWSNTENSFEYLAYIYNDYCYLRKGSEFYKVNINNKDEFMISKY